MLDRRPDNVKWNRRRDRASPRKLRGPRSMALRATEPSLCAVSAPGGRDDRMTRGNGCTVPHADIAHGRDGVDRLRQAVRACRCL